MGVFLQTLTWLSCQEKDDLDKIFVKIFLKNGGKAHENVWQKNTKAPEWYDRIITTQNSFHLNYNQFKYV